MAIEVEVLQDTTTVAAKNALDVQGSDVAVVTDNGVKDVEATSNTYVINSGGMYSGSMSGNIPTWLDQAVTNAIADGTVTLSQALSDLDVYVKNMETGVNQSIASLQTADTTMNTLITTNKSESDTALAGISTTLATKITATDATAISQDVLAAEFSDPNSYITNSAWYVGNVKTYADATSANTTSLDAMATVVTDPITGVTATANNIKTGYTTIGLNTDGTLSATANQSEYISAAIGPQQISIDSVDNITLDSTGTYTATTSKLITGADGSISGWTNSNYNGRSDFTIAADTFKVQSPVGGQAPFFIDTATNNIAFNGLVTFGSGQTGTIDAAIANGITTVAVGDKNINITDNLIPITGIVGDSLNSGYQFVGTPIKSSVVGIDTFAEPQITLASGDEVYSPYVDEVTLAYYYRFGITGVTGLNGFKVVTIDTAGVATYTGIMNTAGTLDAAKWYIVDGIINPTGGNTDPSGSVRLVDGTKIGTVDNIVLDSTATRISLGFDAPETVSRIKLAKITADTITGSLATTDYVNTTTIDGSRITTGKIQSADASTYFDLTNSRLVMGGGAIMLDSRAAGTSVAPNISGGYIKGSTIEGVSINGATITGATIDATSDITSPTVFTDKVYIYSSVVGNYCKVVESSVVFSGVSVTGSGSVTSTVIAVGAAVGVGYDARRVKNSSVKCILTGSFNYYNGGDSVDYSIAGTTFGLPSSNALITINTSFTVADSSSAAITFVLNSGGNTSSISNLTVTCIIVN